MTPTQAAKRRSKRGGAPVVHAGPSSAQRTGPVPAVQSGPVPRGYGQQMQQGVQPVQGIPLQQAMNPQAMQADTPQKHARSPEEVKADMDKLNKAIQDHADSQALREESEAESEEKEKTEEPNVEEEGGGIDTSDAWLFQEDPADILNNPKVRKRIEKGLIKLSVEDLILHGEVVQDVVLIKNKDKPNKPRLWVSFRSISGMEDLAIKKRFYEEEGPDRFMLDRYSLMNLCTGVRSINGVELPSHLDEHGDFDEDGFKIKYRKVSRMAQQLLGFLVVNYIWFDERVRKTLVAEELGNG